MGLQFKEDLVTIVGEYQKDGQTKKKYKNIGKIMVGEDGRNVYFIDKTFNPSGVPSEGDSAVCYGFEPRGNSNVQRPPQSNSFQDTTVNQASNNSNSW